MLLLSNGHGTLLAIIYEQYLLSRIDNDIFTFCKLYFCKFHDKDTKIILNQQIKPQNNTYCATFC